MRRTTVAHFLYFLDINLKAERRKGMAGASRPPSLLVVATTNGFFTVR